MNVHFKPAPRRGRTGEKLKMRTGVKTIAVCLGFVALASAAIGSGREAGRAAAAARRAAPTAKAEFVPVAVWYSGGKSRAPMISRDPAAERQQWLSDLRTIKATGFNTVKTWVDWATTEPREGEFHLEGLKQLLDLAQQTGLRVIVQVYADSAPDWVGRKYPDAEFVTSTGVKIQSQAAPGFCFDHPGVRAAVLEFYGRVAKVAAASPAFYGYDLWSEPHIVNWVWFNDLPNAQFCYCPYTRARFRRWLRRKYGTLDRLNAAWYRTFQNWDEVDPPRYGTILSYSDFMDWEQFIPNKLAEDLAAKAAAVRAFDPSHVTSSHSDAPSVAVTPLSDYGMPDDWQMAKRVDYYGTSIYPKHAESPLHGRDAAARAFAFDGAYSASERKGFFTGELQAGQGATGLRVNDPIAPSDIADWAWSLVAHGAKAICFYAWYPMNAGYESDGYGFINLDGSMTARAREGGQIAQAITAHSALFHDAQPTPARIAILYNPDSYLSGGDTVGPGSAVHDSMLGVYRALFDENVPVEFIHTDDVEKGMLARYRAVYLPYAITLPTAAAHAIAEYVRAGGIAISDARLAWNNARGFANERIPGAGLDEVFGVTEDSLWPGTTTRLTFDADAPAGLPGLGVPAAQFEEALRVQRGQVLAHFADGRPAVVASKFGSGRTIFIGTFLGLAAERQYAEANKAMTAAGANAEPPEPQTGERAIQALMKWAGIEAPLSVEGPDRRVEIRLLQAPSDESLLIAINRGRGGDYTVRLPRAFATGENLISGERVDLAHGDGGTELKLSMGDRTVAVIEMTGAAMPAQ
jgi:beta-galactosidase